MTTAVLPHILSPKQQGTVVSFQPEGEEMIMGDNGRFPTISSLLNNKVLWSVSNLKGKDVIWDDNGRFPLYPLH